MTPTGDRRTGQPMKFGFWIGNGPRKFIVPVSMALLSTVGGGAIYTARVYGQQVKLAAELDERAKARDKQFDSLQAKVATIAADVEQIKLKGVTSDQMADLKSQISELRVVLLRSRE